jgi:hypothetical protein
MNAIATILSAFGVIPPGPFLLPGVGFALTVPHDATPAS